MKRLAILGAGGHGRVAADIAETLGWQEIVFYDDAFPVLQKTGEWVVAGNKDAMLDDLNTFDGYFIAIGNNFSRRDNTNVLQSYDVPLVSLVHPQAVVSKRVNIRPGVMVVAGAVVNIGVQLGRGCIVNTGAVVDHDCALGEFTHISPGACLGGGVRIGDCSWVGLGSVVKQLVAIGENAMAGAGAVVIQDVTDNHVVVGNPARFLRHTIPLNVLQGNQR